MFPSEKKMCHLTGFTKSCLELCVSKACQDRWVHITGENPQTGEPIDKWGCVDDQAVTLHLDQTRRLHMLAATLQDTRNDIVKLQLEQIARSERQHREALAPLDEMRGMTRLTPPEPGITLLSHTPSSEEPN